MSILNSLFAPASEKRASLGLLLFRLVTGAALMLHGSTKIVHPFTWMPHSSVPAFLQCASAVAEFGGGLALILGLLTPLACILIAINMLVAITTVHLAHGDPWVGHKGSFESALGYLASAVLLLLTGPGKFSLDRAFVCNKLDSVCAHSRKVRPEAWV